MIADAAPIYMLPWWATLLLLFALGVALHLGVHAFIQAVAARKRRDQLGAVATGEATKVERAYRLPWTWLAASWVTALGLATVSGSLLGAELMGSAVTGASICSAGSLSSWAGPTVKRAITGAFAKAGGQ